jgi:CheY-like chemotaxis protein
MKKIDSLNINLFKTLYEPLNTSKIKLVLENYHSESFNAARVKKVNRKKFNAGTSKFDANVLIAEDNIINQKLIKRTLEDLGLTITIASNGLEAFQKRKDGNFDLVFMDIQMPFLDGVEATKEILDYEEDWNQPHVPIIALTANALKGDRERFLEAGLDEYTTKPLVRSEIVSLLNHFLADHIIEEQEVPKDVNDLQEGVSSDPIDNFESTQEETLILDIPDNIDEENSEDIAEDEPEQIIEEEEVIEEEVFTYKADILLAKKSGFESKLYVKIISSLGYSCETASSSDELNSMISNNSYKVVLFDKESERLTLDSFSQLVKESNSSKNLESALVLITDSATLENPEDASQVNETIKNVVNKDLLKTVFEKYI